MTSNSAFRASRSHKKGFPARGTIVSLSFCFVFLFLAGCAGAAKTTGQASSGIDGIACAGKVETPPAGLIAADDTGLLQAALGRSGQGKLCEGKVFLAAQPVTVYRVWNSAKSHTVYGSWWSFALPKGPKQHYREAYGICPSWSALDRMTSCSIKVGAKIVVGPGQSAQCEQETYAKSAVNQVFIPNDPLHNVLHVENCTPGIDWP